jgi:heme/copper-type cytochrome/quinol oxidase subunit 4
MKVEIDFQSTNRFLMSIGFAICTISIVPAYMLLYGSNSKNTTIFLIISLALVLSIGLLLIYKGYIELKRSEDQEKKIKFEFMVNQILDQDLKLIN